MCDISNEFIKEKYADFDKEMGLLKQYIVPNYHSNLPAGKYCGNSRNSEFAAEIFYSETECLYHVANEIFRKTASFQRKEGELRGLWSNFYEESLEEMHAPDWNSANFNAIPMLCALKDHKDKLEDGVYELLCEASINACHAIIKRNLTIIYTNPTVMDVYVTVVCGELCGIEEFVAYGKQKLDRFYRHIMAEKVFDEYNCPGYSLLIAEIFSILIKHISDKEILAKVNELNFIVWEMLGKHFHFATGELSGPNIRRYNSFLLKGSQVCYQKASGVKLLSDSESDLKRLSQVTSIYQPICPEELKYLFNSHHDEDYSRLITRGTNFPWFDQAIIDTLYMREKYTIGSFSLIDAWNQRRAVSVHIGDRKEKCCIKLRALHDFYDFSSGAFSTVQQKNSAITVVNFHTDHGDTHVDLDPIVDNTVKAKDFRVRFEVECNCAEALNRVEYSKTENGCHLNALGTMVNIEFPFAEMSGEKPFVEVGKGENSVFVDLVFYSGPEKEINLKKLEAFCAVCAISVEDGQYEIKDIESKGEEINLSADINGKSIEIKALRRPDLRIVSTMFTKLFVNGERFENVAGN